MPRQIHYRPYEGIASERERLQRLRRFLEWLYKIYSVPGQFFSDFNKLQEELQIEGGSEWGTIVLLSYLEEKDLKWYNELHRQIRDAIEKNFEDWKKGLTFTLPMYQSAMQLQTRSPGPFWGFSYQLGEKPDLAKLRDIVILKVADELLYGLNAEAIQQCQVCQHYMVKAHPRGKLFCSANCRVKAAMQKKKKLVRKTSTAKG